MRKEYIARVKKELCVSSRKKEEVIRDLNEVFDSAVEHGETEQQVIERLGSPEDFAGSIHEQLGIDCKSHIKSKRLIQALSAVIASIAAFLMSFIIKKSRLPENVIGQADAATSIKIAGPAIDPVVLLMLFGIAALAAAVILTVKYIHSK